MILVLGLLFLGVARAYKKNQTGIDPYLLFTCACAALLIPPISHDYKLPILVGPAAILLQDLFVPILKKDSHG